MGSINLALGHYYGPLVSLCFFCLGFKVNLMVRSNCFVIKVLQPWSVVLDLLVISDFRSHRVALQVEILKILASFKIVELV